MSINNGGEVRPSGARVAAPKDVVSSAPPFARAQMAARTPTAKGKARYNAPIPGTIYEVVDDMVIDTFREMPSIVNDMRNAGMVDTSGVTIYDELTTWWKSRPMGEAQVTQDPTVVHPDTTVRFEKESAPMAFVSDTFSIGWREGPDAAGDLDIDYSQADYRNYHAQEATRNVELKLEDLVLNGAPDDLGMIENSEMHGLTTYPHRNTGNIGDWTTAPENAREDVIKMIKHLEDDGYRGNEASFRMYMGRDLHNALRTIVNNNTDRTAWDYVTELAEIDDIRVSNFIEDDEVLLLRFDNSVIDIAMAADIQTVNWTEDYYDQFARDHWLVYACAGIRPRSDMDGNCGIAHYTVA